MRRPTVAILCVGISGLCAVCFAVFAAYMFDHGVIIHQRSVTRELAKWAKEYNRISSHDDAIRTAEMLGYAQTYYVVGEGYRSTPEVEEALEAQRTETEAVFVKALQKYTGQDFGTNSANWLGYLGQSNLN